MEADFQHFYGLDLTGVFTGELTLRRTAVLIAGLPPGAQFWVWQGGPRAWSQETGTVLAVGHRLESVLLRVNGAKRSDIPKPPEPPKVGWADEEQAEQKRREDVLAKRMERYQGG